MIYNTEKERKDPEMQILFQTFFSRLAAICNNFKQDVQPRGKHIQIFLFKLLTRRFEKRYLRLAAQDFFFPPYGFISCFEIILPTV